MDVYLFSIAQGLYKNLTQSGQISPACTRAQYPRGGFSIPYSLQRLPTALSDTPNSSATFVVGISQTRISSSAGSGLNLRRERAAQVGEYVFLLSACEQDSVNVPPQYSQVNDWRPPHWWNYWPVVRVPIALWSTSFARADSFVAIQKDNNLILSQPTTTRQRCDIAV